MKSNIFKKIELYTKEHLLLSTFLFLSVENIILNTYWLRSDCNFNVFSTKFYTCIISSNLFVFLLNAIPIFIISLFLTPYLNKKDSIDTHPTYYLKFVICFVTVFLSTFIFYFDELISDFDLLALFFAVIYSGTFSVFFAYFSYGSKIKIISQCFIVSVITWFVNLFRVYLLLIFGSL